MELKTRRLWLREFEKADIPVLYAYNQHPEFQRFEAGPLVSEYQFFQIIQDIIAQQAEQPRQSFYFAVVRDHHVIGSSYVTIHDTKNRQAEIGYVIGFEHWGNGYATEAAQAVIRFGFETLKQHRIYAEVISENRASVRVLEKIGMQREAHLRENIYFHQRWWDTCIYAILEQEFIHA